MMKSNDYAIEEDSKQETVKERMQAMDAGCIKGEQLTRCQDGVHWQ